MPNGSEVEEVKKTDLWDFVKSISETGINIMDETNEGEYVPWVVGKAMSQHQDTVLYADFVNFPDIPKEWHYKFLLYSVKKRKRWGKWAKREEEEDIPLLCSFFRCNRKVALSYLNLLNEEQLQNLREWMDRGGKK